MKIHRSRCYKSNWWRDMIYSFNGRIYIELGPRHTLHIDTKPGAGSIG